MNFEKFVWILFALSKSKGQLKFQLFCLWPLTTHPFVSIRVSIYTCGYWFSRSVGVSSSESPLTFLPLLFRSLFSVRFVYPLSFFCITYFHRIYPTFFNTNRVILFADYSSFLTSSESSSFFFLDGDPSSKLPLSISSVFYIGFRFNSSDESWHASLETFSDLLPLTLNLL